MFLPGESPWTEEPSGLQFIGSQRVEHAYSDLAHMHGSEETEERQGQSLQGGRRWGDGMGEGAKGGLRLRLSKAPSSVPTAGPMMADCVFIKEFFVFFLFFF